jgi:hypothetical protein
LREEVERLASEPSVQEAYLQELGTWDNLDELALEFDCSYVSLTREGRLLDAQIQALALLNAELVRISGQENAALWYGIEALRGPGWEVIRKLARDGLQSLDLGLKEE